MSGAAAGMWHGERFELSLPKAAIVGSGNSCAVLLQVDGTGPVIGAGWMAAADA